MRAKKIHALFYTLIGLSALSPVVGLLVIARLRQAETPTGAAADWSWGIWIGTFVTTLVISIVFWLLGLLVGLTAGLKQMPVRRWKRLLLAGLVTNVVLFVFMIM